MRTDPKRRYAVLAALSPLIWLLVLSGIAALIANPLLLPQPWRVLVRLLELTVSPRFLLTVLTSLLRILLGLLLGVAVGAALGLLSFLSPTANALTRPLLTVVRATPVASFIILVWSFSGSYVLPSLISALMVIPIVSDQLLAGLRSADPALGEVAELYRFSQWMLLLAFRMPAALPYLFGALTTSVGFAWKAGIAAEILVTTAGTIGDEIYSSKVYMESVDLWAWTFAVILLSLTLEFFVKKTLHYIRRKAEWAC